MITYSKLGRKGNLGNQLFQIASTIGLAVSNNAEYGFPEWRYQGYFKNALPLSGLEAPALTGVEEREYNYYDWNLGNADYDLSGWLQTEKYFDTALTRHYLEFTDDLVGHIREKYSTAFSKRTILISIRRGDFVGHRDYFQLPVNYYINALIDSFPDWTAANLIVLSDDMHYCRFHFSFLPNVFFGDGLDAMEQLCLGSLCDDFIISNSTFSWWTAWLGEKKGATVVRPLKNFDGQKSREADDRDYYPDRWICYNHLDKKIDLGTVDFYLPSGHSDIAREYIRSLFDVRDIILSATVRPGDSYMIGKNYILPPLLIYYTFLEAVGSGVSVENNVMQVFGVSERFDYKAFSAQKDFGLFSKIFFFRPAAPKKHSRDIYFKPAAVSGKESPGIIINCTAGKFCRTGGYGFVIRQSIKAIRIRIKQTIKKMLSIKK